MLYFFRREGQRLQLTEFSLQMPFNSFISDALALFINSQFLLFCWAQKQKQIPLDLSDPKSKETEQK